MKIEPYADETPLPANEELLQNSMYKAAHEFKTPIACIIGALEIYERTKDVLSPEKQRALITTALQEAHKLNDIVVKILEKK